MKLHSFDIGAFGCVSVGALNRVVYEGATNTTLTCLTVYAGGHMDWILYPFAFPGSSEMVSPTQKGQLRPDSNGFFAMIHQLQSTAHTLVVFNATVSPSARMSFSTAGVYCCTDQTIEVLSHLVVIRKYALPYLNDSKYVNIKFFKKYLLRLFDNC